jgi:hypothetical protein
VGRSGRQGNVIGSEPLVGGVGGGAIGAVWSEPKAVSLELSDRSRRRRD